MYIRNGIAYAGEPTPILQISGVRPLANFNLWVRFSTGEAKIFDFKPLLNEPCYKPLNDVNVFNGVYVDYGCTVWKDGDIDIAPEYLYENSVAVEDAANA